MKCTWLIGAISSIAARVSPATNMNKISCFRALIFFKPLIGFFPY
ncbi:hypothetical protein C4J87_1745 [Pseudomonas sp. R1-43-08]|nr:hypothetical protein C4J88_1764 [Pseudomonas sp. R4-39-08]AZF41914.1 hypothetical protein C4J87_1745 [Pseudomonas sp. R1-43-08]